MQSNQLNQLLLSLKYISNEGLDDEDIQLGIKQFIASVSLPHLNYANSSSFIKEDLIRMRENARNILNIIISEVASTIKGLEKTKQGLTYIKHFREKYPHYVNLNASKEALTFFNSLFKDEYTYSEASELLNITRQTISKYVSEGIHGFKISGKKKIKKEVIYSYFVEKLPKVKT